MLKDYKQSVAYGFNLTKCEYHQIKAMVVPYDKLGRNKHEKKLKCIQRKLDIAGNCIIT